MTAALIVAAAAVVAIVGIASALLWLALIVGAWCCLPHVAGVMVDVWIAEPMPPQIPRA